MHYLPQVLEVIEDIGHNFYRMVKVEEGKALRGWTVIFGENSLAKVVCTVTNMNLVDYIFICDGNYLLKLDFFKEFGAVKFSVYFW